jgi:hypothetical protein
MIKNTILNLFSIIKSVFVFFKPEPAIFYFYKHDRRGIDDYVSDVWEKDKIKLKKDFETIRKDFPFIK